MLAGDNGQAVKIAMEVLCLMAAAQNADKLIDVSRGHIDGCILAHDANLQLFPLQLMQSQWIERTGNHKV